MPSMGFSCVIPGRSGKMRKLKFAFCPLLFMRRFYFTRIFSRKKKSWKIFCVTRCASVENTIKIAIWLASFQFEPISNEPFAWNGKNRTADKTRTKKCAKIQTYHISFLESRKKKLNHNLPLLFRRIHSFGFENDDHWRWWALLTGEYKTEIDNDIHAFNKKSNTADNG